MRKKTILAVCTFLLCGLFAVSQDNTPHHYIDDILAEIHQNIGKWWTIEELAATWGVSVSKLRRDFLEKTDMLPKNYIETLKMKKAAESYLPEYTVIQTANKLGYKDPYHFSRRFKKIVGYAPSQIRDMVHGSRERKDS
jgi:AraC-like DNA-binding protein